MDVNGGKFLSWNQNVLPQFESSNNNTSFAYALQIQEAVNQRLMQTTADTEEEAKLKEAPLHLPPLGLRLSDKAIDEIMRAYNGENTAKYADIAVAGTSSTHTSSGHSGVQEKASTDNIKLKASNFYASFIRIGSWKVAAEREGALVAKCYHAKKKMVWEILKDGLKSKIEIHWSQVLAFRASMVAAQPGILEIELSSPPAFYKEANPRPKKHTLWKNSSDFTDGQALIHRRHYLEFPSGALDKHYEKLIQCDSRMLMLSTSPFPSLSSPFFHSDQDHFVNGTREFSLDFNRDRPNISSSNLQYLPAFSNIVPTPLVDMQQVQAYDEQTNHPCFSINDPTGMFMDFPSHFDENIRNQGAENSMMGMIWGQGMIHSANNILGRDQIQLEPFPILAATSSDQLMRDQIDQDPYRNIPLEIQMNSTIPFQNYNENYSGSAPSYAEAQVGTFSSDQYERYNDQINEILNQLNPSDLEQLLLQCSDDHDQSRNIGEKSIWKK